MAGDAEEQIEQAIAGELRLLQPGIRNDRKQLEALLADDFVEVGKTGRQWSRAQMINSMLADEDTFAIKADDITGKLLADGVVLVRYRSTGSTAQAWRSSVWVRSTGGWQVLYHQGTLIA